MFYRVRDWNNFENNRTKDMKLMQWVALPIRLDGIGYCSIMSLDDGGMIFGFWNALLQVAARCEVRGTLKRGSGQPHDAKSLALITRFKKADVERALFVLSGGEDPDIDWVEKVFENDETAEIPQAGAEIPQEGAECLRYITGHNITEQDNTLKSPKGSLSVRAHAHTREIPAYAQGGNYPNLEDFLAYAEAMLGHYGLPREDWVKMHKDAEASGWANVDGKPWGNWKSKIVYKAEERKKQRANGDTGEPMLNKHHSVSKFTQEVEAILATATPSVGTLRI